MPGIGTALRRRQSVAAGGAGGGRVGDTASQQSLSVQRLFAHGVVGRIDLMTYCGPVPVYR
jgi:hypothetical protein